MKRSKNLLCILLALLMAVSLLPLGAAATPDDDDEETCLVNLWLDPTGGIPYGEQEVAYGESPVRPSDPTDPYQQGRIFLDWYSDKDFKTRFDFSRSVYRDLDLYARFVEESDIVLLRLYLSVDDEYPAADGVYAKGDDPALPADPGQEGKTFMGWYADKNFTTPFDFTQPLLKTTSIYARFVADEDLCWLTYWFGPNDEFPLAGQAVEIGTHPVEVEGPSPEGKVFLGWYADKNFTTLFDFSKPMYEDADIYAKLVAEDDIVFLHVYLSVDDELPVVDGLFARGDVPSMPAEPYQEGKTFLGWYANKSLTVPFDFSQPLNEDKSIYARFAANEDICTLTYWLSPDDGNPLAGQDVEKGTTPIMPSDPAQEGKTFLGWYADKNFTTPFDFSQPMYGDADIYARFVADEDICALIYWFGVDDEYPLVGVEMEKGTIPGKIADPSPEGRTFLGWYTDKSLTVPFDFSKPIYEDTNIYAKWAEGTGTSDKISLEGAKVTVAKQTYTGSKLKPAPTVKLDGKKLKKGTDYTVAYANNKSAGVATVTVTGIGNYTGTATGTFKIICDAPVLKSVKVVSSGVKVTWDASEGAEKYAVYRKAAGGSWEKLGTATKTAYTDKTAQAGVKYAYRVRAVAKNGKTPVSAYAKSKTVNILATPTMKTAKNVKSGIKITWTGPDGAVKYAVYRKPAGGSWEKLGLTTKTAYTDKTAESGVRYAYKVCCVTKTGKSMTSFYSGAKAVTRK